MTVLPLSVLRWDWIPGIRDRNIGIWQDVTLAYTGDVTLAYPQVVTDLPLPTTSSADVTVRMEMTNHAAVGRHVVLCGRIDGVTEFIIRSNWRPASPAR